MMEPGRHGSRARRPSGPVRGAAISIVVLAATVGVAAITLISVQQEIAIGREAQAKVLRGAPRLPERGLEAYVERIGRRLAARSGGPRYPYTFDVANRAEVNAFALPGGPVWVNRGAIEAAQTESQLAAVLAHEVAHIARRHAADQLTKALAANLGLGVLGALLGNSGGALTAQMAAQAATGTAFLKFSRDDEREADRVGAEIMRRAGWDARGMLDFMLVLQRKARHEPSAVDAFFSTHPSPADRIARLRAIVPRYAGGTRDTAQFRAIRRRLRELPPAPRPPRAPRATRRP